MRKYVVNPGKKPAKKTATTKKAVRKNPAKKPASTAKRVYKRNPGADDDLMALYVEKMESKMAKSRKRSEAAKKAARTRRRNLLAGKTKSTSTSKRRRRTVVAKTKTGRTVKFSPISKKRARTAKRQLWVKNPINIGGTVKTLALGVAGAMGLKFLVNAIAKATNISATNKSYITLGLAVLTPALAVKKLSGVPREAALAGSLVLGGFAIRDILKAQFASNPTISELLDGEHDLSQDDIALLDAYASQMNGASVDLMGAQSLDYDLDGASVDLMGASADLMGAQSLDYDLDGDSWDQGW